MSTNISIRPYSEIDGPELFDAATESVSQLNPWLPWCHSDYSLSDAQQWAVTQQKAFESGTEFDFVIEGNDGAFLGACALNYLNRNHRMANVGYWVRTSVAGRGIATSAVRLMADWAFRNTDFNRLEVVVAVGNRASERVAEKVGSVKEAVLAERLWLHGESVAATLYALTRNKWHAA